MWFRPKTKRRRPHSEHEVQGGYQLEQVDVRHELSNDGRKVKLASLSRPLHQLSRAATLAAAPKYGDCL